MKHFPFRRRAPRLAFDVGTANLRVISSEDGIVFDEPAICCFARDSHPPRLISAGIEALPMLGRTNTDATVRSPLCRGVLQDLEATRALLLHARDKVMGGRAWSRAPSLVGIPADATGVERRALLTAALEAGFGHVRLVSEPMAAAIGAGLFVAEPRGSMLVECGAGITEVVVISLGGIAIRHTLRVGGDALDQSICDHLHLRHRFVIGQQTAQRVKLEICKTASGSFGDSIIRIRGKSLETGLPTIMSVPASDLEPVFRKHARGIAEAVKACLAETAPELSWDILENGLTMTGGSAYVPWLADMITDVSGLHVTVAENAQDCVAMGLREMLVH